MDKQNFELARWLVLSNAGGTNPCAAYIDLNKMDKKKLIVDQTLYWYLADSEEAIYMVGLLSGQNTADQKRLESIFLRIAEA